MVPWYEEMGGHFLAGISLSIADRLFSKNAKRHTETRMQEKTTQIEALDYIATVEQRKDRDKAELTPDYLNAVLKARDYFRARGESITSKEYKRGLVERVSDAFGFYRQNERLNNLRSGKRLAAAFGIEFLADLGVTFWQVVFGKGHAFKAIAETTYQAPGLWLGLTVGRAGVKAYDLFKKSKEEKELDKLGTELTRDGKLLAIARSYLPTQHLEVKEPQIEQLAEAQTATQANPSSKRTVGEKVGEGIVGAAEGIGSVVTGTIGVIRKRMQERAAQKEAAEKKRSEELRAPYKNY